MTATSIESTGTAKSRAQRARRGSQALWLPAWALWRREVQRFLRQRNRIIGALATPLIFWFVIGSGMGTSFRLTNAAEDMSYLEYFFPGTILMIMLFTAIFSTITVIEDRRDGFLQGVLIAPISRLAIVLGKLMGGTTLAVLQSVAFLILAPLAGIEVAWSSLPFLLIVFVLIAYAMTSIGYLVAWPLESIHGFHAIMTTFLLPLWMLSGAAFPLQGASTWVQVLMWANPLYYANAALRWLMMPDEAELMAGQPPLSISLLVLSTFAIAMTFLCARMTKKYQGPLR